MDIEEQVKYAQLDMLIELDRICREYGINYFLCGGTLLGAIRHNGFIPWDDDIDVGMLRVEYEKFVSACGKALADEYELIDWDVDEYLPNPFLKMKIKKTHYKETLSKHTLMNDGIFIDIFPFDNAPDNRVLRKIHASQRFLLNKIILLRCGFAIEKKKTRLVYVILKNVSKVFSIRKWKDITANISKKYNKQNTECVLAIGGAYKYNKELVKRSLLENLQPHLFENCEFMVPAEYDLYLRNVYGDYTKLPPESERHGKHEVVYIDLGEYKIKSINNKQA